MPTDIIVNAQTPDETTVVGIKTKELTNAQILALPTTPIEIIPAPGAGKQILLIRGFYYLDALAGAYATVSAGGYLSLSYDGSFDASNVAATVNWFDQPDEFGVHITPIVFAEDPTFAGQVIEARLNGSLVNNKNLVVMAVNSGGNYTGGNAANTLKITVAYLITDSL